MTQADKRHSTPRTRMPAEASGELRALIDRCMALKAPVEALKVKERGMPAEVLRALPPSREVVELEEAFDNAFEALWDAEDAVNAFRPRSAEDICLKARFCLEHMYSDHSAGHGSDVFAWNVLRELAGTESMPRV